MTGQVTIWMCKPLLIGQHVSLICCCCCNACSALIGVVHCSVCPHLSQARLLELGGHPVPNWKNWFHVSRHVSTTPTCTTCIATAHGERCSIWRLFPYRVQPVRSHTEVGMFSFRRWCYDCTLRIREVVSVIGVISCALFLFLFIW